VHVCVCGVNQEEGNTVTCQDESRHGFQDGDFVTFTEVQGMTELNRCEPRRITVLGEPQYMFIISRLPAGLGKLEKVREFE